MYNNYTQLIIGPILCCCVLSRVPVAGVHVHVHVCTLCVHNDISLPLLECTVVDLTCAVMHYTSPHCSTEWEYHTLHYIRGREPLAVVNFHFLHLSHHFLLFFFPLDSSSSPAFLPPTDDHSAYGWREGL